MCGILGIISRNKIDVNKGNVALNFIAHRGPDASSYWLSKEETVFLGHRRLSIIDLSQSGNQPMMNPSQDTIVIFNGEIYNFNDLKKVLQSKGYSFITDSDTEVLLFSYQEWGIEMLQYLEGMFAFSIYDKKSNQFFIARDRAGEKPLYYSHSSEQFIFGSELKSLYAFQEEKNRIIDNESFDYLLTYGYVPASKTIYETYKKLLPGHYMIYEKNSDELQIVKYWELPKFNKNKNNDEQHLEKLDYLLQDSVKKQLISDVPLGVFLSGGIDSSLIATIAAKHLTNLKTFHVRFNGFDNFDESQHAKLVADFIGSDHTVLEADSITFDDLVILARQFDEPMIDSSMIPTYQLCKLVKQHCTVAIGGDGGDELFGGYKSYNGIIQSSNKLKKINYLPIQWAAYLGQHILDKDDKRQFWLKCILNSEKTDLPFSPTFFTKQERNDLYPHFIKLEQRAEQIRKLQMNRTGSLLQKLTAFDFENYMSNDVLVKVDRASMLASLEVRAPFLSKEVIEFAFREVPDHLKADHVERKIILRKLAQKYLPSSFDFIRKQGFSLPIGYFLRQESNFERVKDTLYHGGLFDSLRIKETIEKDIVGEKLFGLLMIQLWFNQYKG